MVTRPVAVLIGPPGSGKTTVGRLLADRLGLAFRDTDVAVEERAGRSVAQIFLTDGEPVFRAMERAAVAEALATQPGIVALGGGAPMDRDTQDLLADQTVVFLDVGIAAAAPRVGFDQSRPLLAVNPRARWIALMATRRPIYEGLATFRVDTSGRSPEAVAAELVDLLRTEVSAQ